MMRPGIGIATVVTARVMGRRRLREPPAEGRIALSASRPPWSAAARGAENLDRVTA